MIPVHSSISNCLEWKEWKKKPFVPFYLRTSDLLCMQRQHRKQVSYTKRPGGRIQHTAQLLSDFFFFLYSSILLGEYEKRGIILYVCIINTNSAKCRKLAWPCRLDHPKGGRIVSIVCMCFFGRKAKREEWREKTRKGTVTFLGKL